MPVPPAIILKRVAEHSSPSMRKFPPAHVFELSDRTSHVNCIADLECVEILGELAASRESLGGSINLDDELDAAYVKVGRYGSVSAHHGLAINLG